MRRALFLDRDGVLNRDTGYPHRAADIAFLPGAFALCRAARARGYGLVIVTNQAGIGRGLYTEAQFQALTRWMRGVFRRRGVLFLGIEHCPFHPTAGIGPYRRESRRRKPGPGMILDAARRHRIDRRRSVLVGDRATDVAAARAAGLGRAVLVSTSGRERAAVPAGTVLLGTVVQAARWMRRH